MLFAQANILKMFKRKFAYFSCWHFFLSFHYGLDFYEPSGCLSVNRRYANATKAKGGDMQYEKLSRKKILFSMTLKYRSEYFSCSPSLVIKSAFDKFAVWSLVTTVRLLVRPSPSTFEPRTIEENSNTHAESSERMERARLTLSTVMLCLRVARSRRRNSSRH